MLLVMNKKYFNGPMIIARHEATSLLCNGYDFNTKNEELKKWWEDFKHFNSFDNLIYTLAENNSLNGRSIVGLEKMGKNVGVIQHYYLATAEVSCDCVAKPRLVKLDIPVSFDNKNYRIERIYTDEEVKSKLYDAANAEQLQISGETIELGKDIVIQKEYKHNLGFVPVVISYNFPFVPSQYQPQNILIRLNSGSDTFYSHTLFKLFFQNDTAYAKDIEELIEVIYKSLEEESAKSQTMVITSGGNGQSIFDNSLMDKTHLDAFRKSGFIVNMNGRDIEVVVKPNQNKLQEIFGLIELLKEDYFNTCALSYPSIGGGNNKHSTEIKVLMLQTIETHNMKRKCLEKSIKEIIYKSALLYGFKEQEIDFLFKLNEASWESELEKVQALQIALQSGVVDKTRAIMKYNNITREKAEQVKEVIDGELKEKQEQMVDLKQNESKNGVNDDVGDKKNVQ